MKKVIFAALMALGMIVTGCSSKKTVTKIDDAQIMQKSRSEQLAEEEPGKRAFGSAVANDPADARIYADNDARGEFVRKLQSVVMAGIRRSQDDATKSKADNEDTKMINDAEQQRNIMQQTLSNFSVSGLVILHSDTYKQKNGQYRCYVCVEYRGDVAKLASELTASYQKSLNDEYGGNNISDEERAKIKIRSEEFHKSVLDELKRMGVG